MGRLGRAPRARAPRRSGDLVEIHTISGEPEDLPPGNEGVVPEQLEVHAKCRRGPGPHFLTGPVWVEGAEPGDVARGADPGGQAARRLGLEPDPALARHPAGGFSGKEADASADRPPGDDRAPALGQESPAQPLLRQLRRRAARPLRGDRLAGSPRAWRQHGQQGAGRRHHRLFPGLEPRRPVLGGRRPCRPGRRRGLPDRDRDRPHRRLRADRAQGSADRLPARRVRQPTTSAWACTRTSTTPPSRRCAT